MVPIGVSNIFFSFVVGNHGKLKQRIRGPLRHTRVVFKVIPKAVEKKLTKIGFKIKPGEFRLETAFDDILYQGMAGVVIAPIGESKSANGRYQGEFPLQRSVFG